MARIECEVRHVVLEGENGREVDGVEAECSECGHCTQSFGEGPASIRRCLVLLKEECPYGANNYYVDSAD